MKKLPFVIIAFVLSSFTIKDDTVTREDKAFLLDYFDETSDNLLFNLKGLSPEQAAFKAAEDRWSVSQCLEHIVRTEKMLFGMLQKGMEQPANPERRDEIKVSDQDLVKGITDRSKRAQAPAELRPDGMFSDVKSAVKAFKKQRKAVVKYAKSIPEEDLRNHVMDTPFGPVDAYQFMLFIAGHSARHTLQIEEVIADVGFPED